MSALSPQKALSAKKLISVRQRLALVPATGRSSASRTPFVVFMVVLLIGGVVGLLAFNTEMQQRSFAASKLQREATALVAKRQQLKMSLQELNSPQHLADAASKLGMVVPANPAFVSLTTGKITGDPLMTTIGDKMHFHAPAAAKPANLKRKARIVTVRPGARTAKNNKNNRADKANKSGRHGAASTKSGQRTGKKGATHTPQR